ncbi:nuclear apoptosis-inducing factor 1-like protein [Labeo rohita]|uniref:Nuclear apoptosis-inducing factor 1-like protein n=1 Tax=Labeo rohita TaxID=84645 RepID=A0A498P380_LABRO|nr:nuclear apoptosis-inducing factor 1-like protein [Labeo rohita]
MLKLLLGDPGRHGPSPVYQNMSRFYKKVRQVKKKWADLKLSTKKRLAALKRSTTQTGGGQPDPRFVLTPTEERVSALIGPESIVGISVGGDTDEHVFIHEEGWNQDSSGNDVQLIMLQLTPCDPLENTSNREEWVLHGGGAVLGDHGKYVTFITWKSSAVSFVLEQISLNLFGHVMTALLGAMVQWCIVVQSHPLFDHKMMDKNVGIASGLGITIRQTITK